MERSLTGFADRLREAGITVSPAEIIDAGEGLSRIDLADRRVFKSAMRSTMVKRSRDIPVFDHLFDLYFAEGSFAGSLPDDHEEELLQSVAERMSQNQGAANGGDLSPVTSMIMGGSFGSLTRLLLQRARGLGMEGIPIIFRGNFFQYKLLRDMGLDQVRSEADQLLDVMRREGLGEDEAQIIRDYVERNLQRLEQQGKSLVEQEVARNRYLTVRRIEDEDLADRNLFQLSEEDVLTMRPAVDRLARRMKDRLSVRLKKAERGRFDLKTTLRKNVGFGGPLADLRFRNKKPAKPQVVALCDVSRSVRNFSRFMLLFLYTLNEVISRLRSFIFVGDLAEVTHVFQEYDLNEAVSMAASGYGLQYRYGTDYGGSLTQFVEQHLTIVNSKTTVIILGDARNNNLNPHLEALEAITDRARKLIWLNPEPNPFWVVGDSVMELYRPYCTVATECGTLKQLSEAVENNLLP